MCTRTLGGNVLYVLWASMYKYVCSLLLCVNIVAPVMGMLGLMEDQRKYMLMCMD